MKSLKESILSGSEKVSKQATESAKLTQITISIRNLMFKYFSTYTHSFTDESKASWDVYFKDAYHLWTVKMTESAYFNKVRKLLIDLERIPGVKMNVEKRRNEGEYTIEFINYPENKSNSQGANPYPIIKIGSVPGFMTKFYIGANDMFTELSEYESVV